MIFHCGWKSHFQVQAALYLCSLELRRNETQTGMRFYVNKIYPNVMNRTDSLDIAFNAHVWLCGCFFIAVILTEILFPVTRYHVNKTRNEMPMHVYQNIGLFWNAAEMKRHVTRTCFHAGLKLKPVWVHFVSHVNVPLRWTEKKRCL